jgi:two-component system cell cycle sensor histidine kinase/response regulator CckA
VGQIQQVVMNLIINAGDAIGANRGYIAVSTSRIDVGLNHPEFERFTQTPVTPGPYALLQVMDTGSGMSQDILGRIFDPFFTTKFSGRGLGLAAVLGIIRGHHGGMRITSVEGKGTKFEVLFPMIAEEPSQEPASPCEDAVVNGTGKTILIIDDEAFVLELLQDILAAADFAVEAASNPLRGIEMFRQHHESISLVILDYSMPEMDGKATFAELLKIDSGVKVLLCSGYTEDEVESVFGTVRPAGFIHKPYKPDILLVQVNKILAEKGSRT